MRKLVFATILICAHQAFSDRVLASDGELKNIGKIQMKLTLPDSKLESQRNDLQNLIRNKLKSADISTDDSSATQLHVKIESGRQTHIVLSTTEMTPLPNNPSTKKEVSIWTREATCSPKEVTDQLSTLLDAFAIQYLKDNKNNTSVATAVPLSRNLSAALATLNKFSPPPPGESLHENSAEATRLNNDGVRALQSGDYETAVAKLQAALKLNPGYVLSRQNLAIVLNNFGLQRRNDFDTARRFFQWAVYIDPTNSISHQNLNGIIRRTGKSDTSFEVRKSLAEDAEKNGDLVGALVEYKAACDLKPDADLRIRAGDIYAKRAEWANALEQYKLAQAISPTADVQHKIENIK